MLAVLAQLGLTRQVGDVTTRIRLSDGQADALVAVQDAGQNPVLEGLLAKLDQRRAADTKTADDVPDETTRAGARELIRDEHLVEEIPLLWSHRLDLVISIVALEGRAEQTSQVSPAAHLLVDLGRDLLLLVPLGDVGLDLVLDPFADLGSESGVGLVEEGGVELQHSIVSGEFNPEDESGMRGGELTPWYQLGSEKGICAPNGSSASASSWPLGVTGFFAGAAALGAATGIGSAAGFASTFLLSRLPTWSCPLYFFSMPSLWYFQNCLEASFPATLWRIFLPPACCG